MSKSPKKPPKGAPRKDRWREGYGMGYEKGRADGSKCGTHLTTPEPLPSNPPRIELRAEDEPAGKYMDEVIGHNCYVHLERMDEHWFCLIVEGGGRRVMVNIGTAEKYRRKVNAKVYADEPVEPARATDETPVATDGA